MILTACAAPIMLPGETPAPTPTSDFVLPLTVSLLYPKPDTAIVMGDSLKSIIQVQDAGGLPVNDARVSIILTDPHGTQAAEIDATAGAGDAYRSDGWPVPHRAASGTWGLLVKVFREDGLWETRNSFQVANSISEDLLNRYGFWLDAPMLRGDIHPSLVAERGDADNGLIRWGGVAPAMHIFPENWVEIQWRKGHFLLDGSDSVRRFLLEELGDLGFTPLREIGAFSPVQFKGWQAWKGKSRGELSRYDMEWMVFYAPEVNKTYALSTMAVLPPPGIDPHSTLRDSFAVFPEIDAKGVAPKPLQNLAPGPRLLSPALGERYVGLNQPIILEWEPVRELVQDEYYEVAVDYNYREVNTRNSYYTRETQFVLPEELYHEPNCQAYSWRVTLMRQTGVLEDGHPTGEPLTYPSLYWYVLWEYPPGEEVPFPRTCLNEQY